MALVMAAALFARVTTLAPNPNMQAGFEAGYRRHLEWHRAHHDTWTWYGWTIVSGERIGRFVDGTFGRSAADLDAPVAPAEDAADNAGNVMPFARLVSSSIYEERPDLCAPADGIAPFAAMWTVTVRAGQRDRAGAALRARRLTGRCLQLVSGGNAGEYVVMIPASKLSDAIALPPLDDASIESIVVETLRFRPDLTYTP